jgi:iron-sulfur cluster repair protein YtfE (RIC family)
MSHSETQGRYRQVAREHALVRERIERIEALLDDLRRRPERASTDATLHKLVVDLRDHLRRHFALEESGGLLGDAVQYYDPGTGRKVEDLVAEHREFEQQLDALVATTERVGAAEIEVARLDAEARALIESLRTHENAENDLVQRLVSQDTGAGD